MMRRPNMGSSTAKARTVSPPWRAPHANRPTSRNTLRQADTLGGVKVDVRRIPVTDSYALRGAVLRTHESFANVPFPKDNEPDTAAFGAVDCSSGIIVSVATVFREPAPFALAEAGVPLGHRSGDATWRLIAMATLPAVQGQGIGFSVLEAIIDYVAAEQSDLLWCTARVPAVGFYERGGFRPWGSEWVMANRGPHVYMWRTLESAHNT